MLKSCSAPPSLQCLPSLQMQGQCFPPTAEAEAAHRPLPEAHLLQESLERKRMRALPLLWLAAAQYAAAMSSAGPASVARDVLRRHGGLGNVYRLLEEQRLRRERSGMARPEGWQPQ